jgi:hypothetical protein
MNSYHDPELDDVLQEDDLRHIASMLKAASTPEPPLDEAFRTGLRRQLMNEAWSKGEGRAAWWRRAFAPPGLAWAGAAAGVLLIASVVALYALQQPAGSDRLVIHGNVDGNRSVALQQPILVSFNQPMDHPSTEHAVQITPATTVTFSWEANTLAVQPASGNLAPNTQYQVTIGPEAKTATGKKVTAPQTITFVTQPPPAALPTPTPRATPSNALGEKQLATLGVTSLDAQWSADSSQLYAIDGTGALKVVPANGGNVTVIAANGVTALAISPAGDRLAYIRDGKIEVLTFASGQTDTITPATAPTLVGWAKDKVLWAAADGVDAQNADGSGQRVVAPLPASGQVAVVSIAPDGAHAIYRQDGNLLLADLSNGHTTLLGAPNVSFAGWSPGGRLLMYLTADSLLVADMQGVTQATLPRADASWSSQDAILLGSDTNLFQVRPDASNLTKLASGTYHSPQWAPNGTAFAFLRGGGLWVATAPALPPQATALDEASAVVNSFMQARVNGNSDSAGTFLDDNGKKAYAGGGLTLIVNADPKLSRYYILTQVTVGTDPDSVLSVVRLVLSQGKIDVSDREENLILVRDAASKQFVIDQATAGGHHDLGKGAEVVSVDVVSDTLKVTFDSDLDPGTVPDGLKLVDSKGKQVDATVSYANRTVTLSGLNLKEGSSYKLVVLTTLRDVLGHNIASEYDLDVAGPAVKKHGNKQDATTPSHSPSPVPAA